jgi:hypothetical protein
MKLLSTEAEGVSEAIPEESRPRLVNAAGRVGALLGLQAPPAPPAADGDGAATSAASASAPQPDLKPRQNLPSINYLHWANQVCADAPVLQWAARVRTSRTGKAR